MRFQPPLIRSIDLHIQSRSIPNLIVLKRQCMPCLFSRIASGLIPTWNATNFLTSPTLSETEHVISSLVPRRLVRNMRTKAVVVAGGFLLLLLLRGKWCALRRTFAAGGFAFSTRAPLPWERSVAILGLVCCFGRGSLNGKRGFAGDFEESSIREGAGG